MVKVPIGSRLREARRGKGLTQTGLAAAVGISVSYLNLIEHDKRSIGGALLNRLAGELDLDIDRLSGLEDARLIQHLLDLAAEPLFRQEALAEKGAQQLVNLDRNWARAVVRLHNAWRESAELVDALSDRLNRDPFMAEASHEILTLITSIRSFSEILEAHGDLPRAQRTRFTSLLAKESEKLGHSATALFRFMSQREQESRPATPAAEVDDFLIDHANYFPDLEAAADDLRARISPSGRPDEAALVAYLEANHAIQLNTGDVPPDPIDHPVSRRQFALDRKARTLRLRASLPASSVRFQLARVAFELDYPDLLSSGTDSPKLTTPDARNRAVHALARYGAGALLLPYQPFLEAAEQLRYDIQLLTSRFAASFEQVCHRLVTLRRPGALGIPFAFMRADPAGNTSKRFSLPELRLPRHGSACPLWVIYRAFQSPGQIVPQLIKLPDERSFLLMARTVAKDAGAFEAPQQVYSIMLACNAAYADRLVYGDGFGRPGRERVTPAGVNCRLCPRPACPQRAHARILPVEQPGKNK